MFFKKNNTENRTKWSSKFFSAFILFLFSACASQQVAFEVVAPAGYPESKRIKSIEVRLFEPLNSYSKAQANRLHEYIENGIANENFITVTSQNSDAILKGQLLVEPVKTEKFIDEEPTLTETLISKAVGDDGDKNKKKYKISKTLTVTGTYSIIYIPEQRKVFADNIGLKFEKTWYSYNNYEEAISEAPSDENIVSNVLVSVAKQIVQNATPHKKTIRRSLQKGKDERLEIGNTYMVYGRTEQALALWDQVAEQPAHPEDKAKAYYNIGVAMEAQGKYQDAFANFSEASMLDMGNKIYLEAMNRVEKAQKEQARSAAQVQN